MDEIDDLRAQRDALLTQNKALTEHARQLIAEAAAKSPTPAVSTSTPTSNTMSRTEFEKLDAEARMAFFKAGGKLSG